MIPRFEIDQEFVKEKWHTEDDRNIVLKNLETLDNFKKFPVYLYIAEALASCFVGHHDIQGRNLHCVKCGYAIDSQSIEKFLEKEYAESPEEYLVTLNMLPMNYQRLYKHGYFVDKDGNYTEEDFYAMDKYMDYIDKTEVKGYFIGFTVYDINRNIKGELWSDVK